MRGGELISLINTAASIKSRQRKASRCCVSVQANNTPSTCLALQGEKKIVTTRHFIARALGKAIVTGGYLTIDKIHALLKRNSAKRCSLYLGQWIIYDAINTELEVISR